MKKIIIKKIKFLLKALVSILFLVWAFYNVNWNEVLEYVGRITWWQTLIYFSLIILGMLISSYKWKLLAEHKKFNLPLGEYFKLYFTGTFINNFMPSFIGGDTFRAYQIGKDKGNYPEAASTVLMDRITGFISATILAVIFTIINFKTALNHKILLIANGIIILSFVLDIAVALLKNSSFIKSHFKKFIPEIIIKFIKELGSFSNKDKVITKSIFWGCLFSIIGVASANYILFLSLGAKISFLNYLSVIFIIAIVAAVPITINNIGIKEWAYVTFFGIFGLNNSLVITIAITNRLLQMLLSFLAIPFYLKAKKIKEEKIEVIG